MRWRVSSVIPLVMKRSIRPLVDDAEGGVARTDERSHLVDDELEDSRRPRGRPRRLGMASLSAWARAARRLVERRRDGDVIRSVTAAAYQAGTAGNRRPARSKEAEGDCRCAVRRVQTRPMTCHVETAQPETARYGAGRDRVGMLLATDLSPTSVLATDWALRMAARNDATLLVVSVIDPTDLLLPDGGFRVRVDQVRGGRESAAQALVERGRRLGIRMTFLVWTGGAGGIRSSPRQRPRRST